MNKALVMTLGVIMILGGVVAMIIATQHDGHVDRSTAIVILVLVGFGCLSVMPDTCKAAVAYAREFNPWGRRATDGPPAKDEK